MPLYKDLQGRGHKVPQALTSKSNTHPVFPSRFWFQMKLGSHMFLVVLLSCLLVLVGCNSKTSNIPGSIAPPGLENFLVEPLYKNLDTPFVLPEPPKYLSDPIVDSKWSRHPIMLGITNSWIDHWIGEGHEEFSIYLERMGRYAGHIDLEIKSLQLPSSLRYLPIIESGFRPRATSSAKATGLWQFMRATAREVGLRVSAILDERRDPIRSTEEALAVLKDHNERFNSWYLSLAAYNAGPSRVSRLLKEHAPLGPLGDSLYLVIHPFLPRETQEFVPKFLAAAQIGRSPVRYGFRPVYDSLVSFDEVILTDATSVDVIAQAAETAQRVIEEMNPQLIRGFTSPGSETRIMLPSGKGAIFERNYQLIPEDERFSVLEHQVVSGDTLGHIALRYGVSVSVLLEANPGVQPTRLQIGYWLRVPAQ